MRSFAISSEEEKGSAAYRVCVVGSAGVGMAYGSFAGGVLGAGVGSAPAAQLGGLIGFGMGLAACPHLKEPIKMKLFSTRAPLTDHELMSSMQAVRSIHPQITKKDAIQLIAELRSDAVLNPTRYHKA